jgi:aquaporin Z
VKNDLSKSLVAETIGTFALIFIGTGVGALGIGGLVGVSLAFGLVVVSFAYSYGHISGTHLNPAVTIGVWLAGKMNAGKAFSYVVFQLLGGALGAFALRYVLGGTATGLGATTLAQGLKVGGATISITPGTGVVIEAIVTFCLVNTVLNAAISGKGGEFAGLAVGLTLAVGILMSGPLTGGSLNPARSLGPAMALGEFSNLWVYFVGPIAGAAAASGLYRGILGKH